MFKKITILGLILFLSGNQISCADNNNNYKIQCAKLATATAAGFAAGAWLGHSQGAHLRGDYYLGDIVDMIPHGVMFGVALGSAAGRFKSGVAFASGYFAGAMTGYAVTE